MRKPCRDCGGEVPLSEHGKPDGCCPACLAVRDAEGEIAAEKVRAAFRGEVGIPRPRVRNRTCAACGGPGGRRWGSDGLCGPCRDAMRVARAAARRIE